MMITTKQAAKLEVAKKLIEARNLLLDTRSSIVWTGEGREIIALVDRIDTLFQKVIP